MAAHGVVHHANAKQAVPMQLATRRNSGFVLPTMLLEDGHRDELALKCRRWSMYARTTPPSMFKTCLIVLGIVAAASAIPVPGLISDALMVNASSGYNPGAAVAYAKANCNSGQGLCAEFASRSMAAGGAGNPVITWVPDLVDVRPCVTLLNARILHSRSPTVDDQERLENDRVPVLRPRWLRRHLRRDFLRQRPRSLLSRRRPYLPAQPRPLQVVLPSCCFLSVSFASFFLSKLSDPTSHASASFSTSGDWGTHRVYCYGC